MLIRTDDLQRAVANNDIAQLLTYCKVEVNSPDKRGETPIFNAIRQGNQLLVHLLIERGADLTHIGIDGWNVLHYAAHAKNYDMIHFLIEKLYHTQQSMPIEAVSSLGYTPLHFAQCPFIIKNFALLLTFYGKQPYLKEKRGLSIFSADIQKPIEQHMLNILMERYYRRLLLDIILAHTPGPNLSPMNSIIHTVFSLRSDKKTTYIDELIALIKKGDSFYTLTNPLIYKAIFKNHPLFTLYSDLLFKEAFQLILEGLKIYLDFTDQERANLINQVEQDAQHEVQSIMTYYKEENLPIHNKPFTLA
jgi:ankyrin repeat protein